jgi:hypothetical protein
MGAVWLAAAPGVEMLTVLSHSDISEGAHTMLRNLSRLGLVVVLGLAAGHPVMAQAIGNADQGAVRDRDEQRVKPSGPAATKADGLMRAYTARIEKEIEQGRKELERLRAELHELIDVRSDMAEAIADLRGDLAAKGMYSADLIIPGLTVTQDKKAAPPQAPGPGMGLRRDLFYGLGSALPRDPTPQQREQLRRLAPRSDLKRTIERLRAEVEETRAEVDQLAYKLLELRAGIPASYQGFGGMVGGMSSPWFGTMGMQGVGGMM